MKLKKNKKKKHKKISYRGSEWEHNEHQEHNHWCSQRRKSKLQGIPANVTDDELEEKVIDILVASVSK